MMRRVWAAAFIALCLSASTGRAQAPAAATPPADSNDEVARGLFQAGKAAYDGGNYAEALTFFEQAHARSGRPQLLFNIGQVADRLRQDEKALESFKSYLAQVPNATNRVEVEARIKLLEQAIAERKAAAAAPVTAVPTPAATAAQSEAAQPEDEHTQQSDQPVTRKWWFWTSIGAGAVAVAVVIAVTAASGGDPGTEPGFEGTGGSFPGP